MALPNLEQIIPLVGVTMGVVISFILPPIIQTLTMWDEWRQGWAAHWRVAILIKNAVLVMFGVAAFALGLAINIKQLTSHMEP